MKLPHTRTQGFTIVELLIVVVVIGVLAAISVVAYTGVTDRAQRAALQSDLRQLSTQIEIVGASTGAYPESLSAVSEASRVVDARPTVDYTYTATADSYCLEVVDSARGVSYFIDNIAPTPREGTCPDGEEEEEEAPVVVAPTITTTSLPGLVGDDNTSYPQTIAATGTTPLTFSIVSGSLPAGMTLNTTTGVLSYSLNYAADTSSFTVRAANSAGYDDQAYTIEVVWHNQGGGN